MADAKRFALELDREFVEQVEDHLHEVVQKIAIEGLSRIVLKSPVDTGRFRNNWFVTIGAADEATTTDVVDPSGSIAINRGTAVVSAMPDVQVIWIQNNLPYAGRLEDGWSGQAPNGMVAVTVAELEQMFARIE